MRRTGLISMHFLLLLGALAIGCGDGDGADSDLRATSEASHEPSVPGDASHESETSEPTMQHARLLKSDVPQATSDAPDQDLAALVADHTAFAVWMYHHGLAQLEEDAPGANFVFSPLSMSAAFGMLWPGAAGETAEDIAAMLHFNLPDDRFHAAAARLSQEVVSLANYEPAEEEGPAPVISLVNDVWLQQDFPIEQTWLDLLSKNYGVGIWLADFTTHFEEVRQEINAHVASNTNDLIRALLPPGSVSRLTVNVLTNALYFRGSWQMPFDPEETRDGAFTALGGNTETVTMMHQSFSSILHAYAHGAQILRLPYVGQDLGMLLILPDEGTFSDFEASLDADTLHGLVNALEPNSGSLKMLRFELGAQLDLRDLFMDAAFYRPFIPGEADFSRLSPLAIESELHVSGAFHDAHIAVDEEGTEAAAATGIVDGVTGGSGDPFEMVLDRPFLFLIQDQPTGAVLFMGRVTDAHRAQRE